MCVYLKETFSDWITKPCQFVLQSGRRDRYVSCFDALSTLPRVHVYHCMREKDKEKKVAMVCNCFFPAERV